VPVDLEGAEATSYAEQDMGETEKDYETIKVYQTSFATPKGEIIVEYRNSSNGYYGGWLQGPTEHWAQEKTRIARDKAREESVK
jgi:predicted Mrr-cat superfamily restriction endonuclease